MLPIKSKINFIFRRSCFAWGLVSSASLVTDSVAMIDANIMDESPEAEADRKVTIGMLIIGSKKFAIMLEFLF